jgi:hypothetical protein
VGLWIETDVTIYNLVITGSTAEGDRAAPAWLQSRHRECISKYVTLHAGDLILPERRAP